MKTLLAICLFTAAACAWAGEKTAPAPAAAATIKGEVLEVKEVESYTYLRLKTRDGETWAAVGKAPVKTGTQVTIENVMVMSNFESKSLKQTFKTILFGTLAGAGGSQSGVAHGAAMGHGAPAATADVGDVHVAKASGANARTVAEVMSKGAELKDKPVVVHGKVVKYNAGIMGKNWVHLRDGTGMAPNNDVLVTTTQQTKLGEVVTVKGVVHTDKDFGSGYAYKVIIEEATLQP